VVIALLLVGLLFRSTIAFWLPPGFDEGYYYLYTQHPAWSYFDHPLLVALTTGFGPWLTGNVSQFTIRLGTLLLHTGALLLLYLTSAQLFSRSAALLTLTIATLIPIFLVGFGVLTLPDSPLIFFWTATLYVAAREFFPHRKDSTIVVDADAKNPQFTPHPSPLTSHSLPPDSPTYRIAIIGLLAGLACLGKYHGLALAVGLVGFCLTSPRHRTVFLSPWMLLSLGLFILAVSPILVWNAHHDWVSLRFQSGRAVPDRGYSLIDLLVTFLAGVAYLFPTFGFPLWWVSGKEVLMNRRDAETQRDGDAKKQFTQSSVQTQNSKLKSRFLLWTALPLMLGFTLMGGYRSILPTWAMPGFWSATLLLGQAATNWQQRSPRLVKRWLWGSGIAVAVFLLVALLHVTLGTFQKPSRYALFGGFLTPTQDASVQLIDIQQLRQGFTHSPQIRTALEQTNFLFTNDLYLAGQLGMAILAPRGSTNAALPQRPITCFDKDLRGFAFWSTNNEWVGKNGLLVTTDAQTKTAIAQYQDYFKHIQKIADIPIQRGGTIVQVIQIYQANEMLKPYPRPYGS